MFFLQKNPKNAHWKFYSCWIQVVEYNVLFCYCKTLYSTTWLRVNGNLISTVSLYKISSVKFKALLMRFYQYYSNTGTQLLETKVSSAEMGKLYELYGNKHAISPMTTHATSTCRPDLKICKTMCSVKCPLT